MGTEDEFQWEDYKNIFSSICIAPKIKFSNFREEEAPLQFFFSFKGIKKLKRQDNT